MKHISTLLVCTCIAIGASQVTIAEEPYNFRQSEAYKKLPKGDQTKLEHVHRDFMMLWGALDKYADRHDGQPPETLDKLVPFYLSELPSDPFASKTTAEKKDAGAYSPSKNGWGYQYRKGSPGNRAWIIASVGLPEFPYLAERGNISLYIAKGRWISGFNPVFTKE